MGLFDDVVCEGEAFKCSEGHDLTQESFQTKDLGETMGSWRITDRLECTTPIAAGTWGNPPEYPFLGRINVYTTCRQCPAFVQAKTLNLVDCEVEFTVEVVDDVVRKITRVSPTTQEWLATEPKRPWMANCEGPMPWEDAQARHRSWRPQ